ncbi:MAG TPA: riboflavin kinase [Ktedonobacterales bacterium]
MSATRDSNKTRVARVIYRIGRMDSGPVADGPIAIVVSDFDGAHTGHVALATLGVSLAEASGAAVMALLPWPSPAGGDNTAAPRLTTLEERIRRLRDWGVFSAMIIVPMPGAPLDAPVALARIRALGDVRALVSEANPVGAALALLSPEAVALAEAEGLLARTQADPAEATNGASVAGGFGARIAASLESGRLMEATAALGYPYTVTGEVIGGDRRGRLLGYPTANLRPDPSKIIPANGIYAARVRLPGDDAPCQPAVVSIGVRPTFGADNRRLIEAHLLDATLDLYGATIEVEFVAFLRPEVRFESVEALIEQMDRDSDQSRRLLGVK